MSESESKRTPRKRASRARRGQDVTSGEGATVGQGAAGGQETTRGRATPERGEILDVEIRRRAYELYLARGGAHGAALDDWLAAEHELRREGGDGAGG